MVSVTFLDHFSVFSSPLCLSFSSAERQRNDPRHDQFSPPCNHIGSETPGTHSSSHLGPDRAPLTSHGPDPGKSDSGL